MKPRHLFALALLVLAAPVSAERLQFDHRLYPPLAAVLDSGNSDMVDFNAVNPQRLVDLIAVRGKSVRDWTEALEIVSIARPAKAPSLRDWMAQFQQQASARCPQATFAIITEDTNSVTFERHSAGCKAERAELGIYRLVAGKRSWFQLGVLSKAGLDDAARGQWLALLASAHLD